MSEFQNAGPLTIKVSRSLKRFFSRNISNSGLMYDHGCGYGGWTKYISDTFDMNAAIFDPDSDAHNYTKNLISNRFSNAEGPFDTIICFGVLELLEEADQELLLKKFKSSLKGKLLVQYNFYNPFSLRWMILRLKNGDPIKWHEENRFHRTYFSRNHIENIFMKSGFKIVEKCHPNIENHLPFFINNIFGPIVPSRFHMTFYYSLEVL